MLGFCHCTTNGHAGVRWHPFIRSDSVDQRRGWIWLRVSCSQKQALMAYLEALGRNSPSRSFRLWTGISFLMRESPILLAVNQRWGRSLALSSWRPLTFLGVWPSNPQKPGTVYTKSFSCFSDLWVPHHVSEHFCLGTASGDRFLEIILELCLPLPEPRIAFGLDSCLQHKSFQFPCSILDFSMSYNSANSVSWRQNRPSQQSFQLDQ